MVSSHPETLGPFVRAARRIEQSPLSEDWIEIDGLYAVDFDPPFGVVLREPADLRGGR